MLSNEVKEQAKNVIIEKCKEVMGDSDEKELLGLKINFYAESELIDMGCTIVIFDLVEDEGDSWYVSYILDNEEIGKKIKEAIKNEKDSNMDSIDKVCNELKEYFEKVKWSEEVKIAEEFYVDDIEEVD